MEVFPIYFSILDDPASKNSLWEAKGIIGKLKQYGNQCIRFVQASANLPENYQRVKIDESYVSIYNHLFNCKIQQSNNETIATENSSEVSSSYSVSNYQSTVKDHLPETMSTTIGSEKPIIESPEAQDGTQTKIEVMKLEDAVLLFGGKRSSAQGNATQQPGGPMVGQKGQLANTNQLVVAGLQVKPGPQFVPDQHLLENLRKRLPEIRNPDYPSTPLRAAAGSFGFHRRPPQMGFWGTSLAVLGNYNNRQICENMRNKEATLNTYAVPKLGSKERPFIFPAKDCSEQLGPSSTNSFQFAKNSVPATIPLTSKAFLNHRLIPIPSSPALLPQVAACAAPVLDSRLPVAKAGGMLQEQRTNVSEQLPLEDSFAVEDDDFANMYYDFSPKEQRKRFSDDRFDDEDANMSFSSFNLLLQ